MKKALMILIVMISSSMLFCIDNRKAKVAFYSFINYSDDSSYDIPCNTASDNIELSLKLLDIFDLYIPSSIPRDMSNETLSKWCLDENIDYVIYGLMTLTSDGFFESKLIIYNKNANSKTEKKEKFESILDIFSVTDNQTAIICDEIAQKKIVYGSLVISNKPVLADIIIDGNNVGSEKNTFERISVGYHHIEVLDREKKYSLVDKDINITEGVKYSFDCLSIDTESKKIKKTDKKVSESSKQIVINEKKNPEIRRKILSIGYSPDLFNGSIVYIKYVNELNSFFYLPFEISYSSYKRGSSGVDLIDDYAFSVCTGTGFYMRFYNKIEPFIDICLGYSRGNTLLYINEKNTPVEVSGMCLKSSVGANFNLSDHLLLGSNIVIQGNGIGGGSNFIVFSISIIGSYVF